MARIISKRRNFQAAKIPGDKESAQRTSSGKIIGGEFTSDISGHKLGSGYYCVLCISDKTPNNTAVHHNIKEIAGEILANVNMPH